MSHTTEFFTDIAADHESFTISPQRSHDESGIFQIKWNKSGEFKCHLQGALQEPSTASSGKLRLYGIPDDGDKWSISDGTETVVFEFDSDSSVVETSNLRQVVIGATVAATLTTLKTAVNAADTLSITAGTVYDNVVELAHDSTGPNNVRIEETVNASNQLRSSGMQGGATTQSDWYDIVTFEYIGGTGSSDDHQTLGPSGANTIAAVVLLFPFMRATITDKAGGAQVGAWLIE